MRAEVRDAIESARTATAHTGLGYRRVEPSRTISAERLTQLLKAVLQEVPDGMTCRELLDELP